MSKAKHVQRAPASAPVSIDSRARVQASTVRHGRSYVARENDHGVADVARATRQDLASRLYRCSFR
jgi:hypothetical protein